MLRTIKSKLKHKTMIQHPPVEIFSVSISFIAHMNPAILTRLILAPLAPTPSLMSPSTSTGCYVVRIHEYDHDMQERVPIDCHCLHRQKKKGEKFFVAETWMPMMLTVSCIVLS